MLLMCRCCRCTVAANALMLMLLMRWCCWCADADALMLLMHWCYWSNDAAVVDKMQICVWAHLKGIALSSEFRTVVQCLVDINISGAILASEVSCSWSRISCTWTSEQSAGSLIFHWIRIHTNKYPHCCSGDRRFSTNPWNILPTSVQAGFKKPA